MNSMLLIGADSKKTLSDIETTITHIIEAADKARLDNETVRSIFCFADTAAEKLGAVSANVSNCSFVNNPDPEEKAAGTAAISAVDDLLES